MRYLPFLVRLAHRLPILLVLGLLATAAQATVMTYDISTLNSYIRERTDARGLPVVTDTRTSLSGQIVVDTANGELVLATIALNDYSETYDYDGPFGNADYAVLNYSGEMQDFSGGETGVLSGTTLSFSGANQWVASSVNGSVSCSDSAGSNGNALCSSPALEPWGPFDIDLLFNNDFSSFIASTTWSGPGTGGTTEDFHQLDIQGVRAVSLPATAWLVMSGLLGLVVSNRRQCATKI